MAVERQVRLRFSSGGPDGADLKDLSTVHRDRRWLWLAGDELPRLERLTEDPLDVGLYADHRSFPLGDLVELPEGPDTEVDVEGMDRHGSYLWVVGSHSPSRRRVKPKDVSSTSADDLAIVRTHPNRRVVLRIPIADDDSDPVPARSTTTASGEVLTAARFGDAEAGGLIGALGADPHLKDFLTIPGKDNGLDIEGLAALANDRILLGLRGPVLRGWAVVFELNLRDDHEDPAKLNLGSAGFQKYFLDLDGLGVRDLCRDGDDILVLAGPTMDLDGPVGVYRWFGAASSRESEFVSGDKISERSEVPFGDGKDHAEGITLEPGVGPANVLVVYDSPAKKRIVEDGRAILADIVSLQP